MIGIDLTIISRIEGVLNRKGQRFLDKCFTVSEQELIKNSSTLSGFFAAKEAAFKALGVKADECTYHDIIISKTKKGQPVLKYKKKIRKKFHINESSLSITHDGGFAIAVVSVSKK
tara:strand:- start:782 stop:1129 length:348 start_codon:yes stop_codon:yes gene_type:complete